MTSSDAEITELPASPGARLRREREARGMTEQQAAELLTLDGSVIVALEANDYAALGAPVFLKGHLRRYATLLGLPEDEVLGAYERSKQQIDEPTLVPKSRLEMIPVRGRPKWPWVVGGAVAFLLAAALAAFISENGLPRPGGAERSDEPPLAAAAGGAPAVEPAAGPGAIPSATDETPADASGASVPAGAIADTTDKASTSTRPAATSPGRGEADARPARGAFETPTATGQVSLYLRFSGDSWVEIFDGSGKAVVYDLGKGGTERTLVATPPLSVTLSNAAAVTVAISGAVITPPRTPGQAMTRFTVAPDGSLR